ncbi:hypothetical protein PoB_003545100 [Plakobranchus ocellatus]|uniref:Uncharacterized protein n=1 Tax=Plakobranchus ocellatus TaxID=259542 RepID=A0AAV4AKW7_9GAST|nr:hypothetical protein PoB_003545100 [Plakobranchus ocellatus]
MLTQHNLSQMLLYLEMLAYLDGGAQWEISTLADIGPFMYRLIIQPIMTLHNLSQTLLCLEMLAYLDGGAQWKISALADIGSFVYRLITSKS